MRLAETTTSSNVSGSASLADCLPHQADCLPHQSDCLPHQVRSGSASLAGGSRGSTRNPTGVRATPSPRATPRVSKLANAADAAAAVAAAPPVARGQLAPIVRARGTSPYASSSMAPSWAHLARPLMEAGRLRRPQRRPHPRRRPRPRRRGCARSSSPRTQTRTIGHRPCPR